MRMHRPALFMESALLQAKRSTCFRLNVGAVIVDRDRRTIIATGYNGPASEEPHCSGGACAGNYGCDRAIHAETNALGKLDKISIRMPWKSLDLYTTHSPCAACMVDLCDEECVMRVFFQTEYRNVAHLSVLTRSIEIYKVTPAGYITKFGDNTLIDPDTLY